MRIGIFVLAAGRSAGGPETYEVQLIRGLARIDSQNRYFIYCAGAAAARAIGPLPENFAVRVLWPAFRPISVAFTLPARMLADRLDFFHATYAPPPVSPVPFLFTMHCFSNFARPDFYPRFILWRLNALQKKAIRRARAILCVSGFVAGQLREQFHIEAERLATVYNGAGAEFHCRPREAARAIVAERFGISDPFVLYVGKLQARKNIIGLIRAYAQYRRNTGSNAKLALAGRMVETSEGIVEAIAELGLQDDVILPGYVEPPAIDPESALPYLYSAASMAVFPSFYEGFGIPVIEAMACGCPVIASNVTSLPEIAGDAAILVDPNSIDEIASAMARLDDPGERRKRIAFGLERARKFTWENCARETLEQYQRFGQR